MSTLTSIWLVADREDLTAAEKAAQIADLKVSEWAGLSVPLLIGSITVIQVSVHGQMVELDGAGGTLDWPLQLVNAPIAVPDDLGPDFDVDGRGWRVDVAAVLEDVLGRYQ